MFTDSGAYAGRGLGNSATITILLVEDHKLLRDSWALVLNSYSHFRVVGACDNVEEAVNIAIAKKPDIVLMDINMSPVDGFDGTKLVREHSPSSRVIGLSMHSMPAYAKRMLQLGAMGYITKNSSTEEMIEAIIEVNSGKKYICGEIRDIMTSHETKGENTCPDKNMLSFRELDIIQLIKEGMSSREIAEKLDLSTKTVDVHRYNILKKLNIRNTAALVNFINTNGL